MDNMEATAGGQKAVFSKGGIFSKKMTDDQHTEMMGAKKIVMVNGEKIDFGTTAGKAQLNLLLNSITDDPNAIINGQKLGTKGAQFEMSKLRALATGNANTEQEAKEIAKLRGYTEGSKEPVEYKRTANFRNSGNDDGGGRKAGKAGASQNNRNNGQNHRNDQQRNQPRANNAKPARA